MTTMETNSTTSSNDNNAWPPISLRDNNNNPQDIIHQCECMEMSDTDSAENPIVPMIEMAALLYLGDYVHARHLWSRYRPIDGGDSSSSSSKQQAKEQSSTTTTVKLEDWWKIAQSMMEYDISNVITLLLHVQQKEDASSSSPFATYAKEIGEEYQFRVLQQLVATTTTSTTTSTSTSTSKTTTTNTCEMKYQIAKYFNIHSPEELQQYYYSQMTQRQNNTAAANATTTTTTKPTRASAETMISFFETPLWTM